MRTESSVRDSIRANRGLLARGTQLLSVQAMHVCVRALKTLEDKVSPREPFYHDPACVHAWNTQDEAGGKAYCLACGKE